MPAPVLRRPALSLSTQRWRSGAAGASTGISIGWTRALPIKPPPWAGACPAGVWAGAGPGVGAGVAAGFFLKKLNIEGVLRITRFYETHPAFRSCGPFPSFAALV